MPEQVHSRINELMSLHEFMADANIKSGSKTAKTIMNIWAENQMPYVVQYPKDAPMHGGQVGRAFYNTSSNFPVHPDTLNIKEGSISDWIAEMSHAVQYNKPRTVRDSLDVIGGKQNRMHGEWRYGTKSVKEGKEDKLFYPSEELLGALLPYIAEENPDVPVEFEAHMLIEPLLEERYYKAVNEDLAKENPIDAKAIELLKKYLFKDKN